MSYESIFDTPAPQKPVQPLYPAFSACPGKCYNKKAGSSEPNSDHISLVPKHLQQVSPRQENFSASFRSAPTATVNQISSQTRQAMIDQVTIMRTLPYDDVMNALEVLCPPNVIAQFRFMGQDKVETMLSQMDSIEFVDTFSPILDPTQIQNFLRLRLVPATTQLRKLVTKTVSSHPYANKFVGVHTHKKIMLSAGDQAALLERIDQLRKINIAQVLNISQGILPDTILTQLRAMDQNEVVAMFQSTSTEELAHVLTIICSEVQIQQLLHIIIATPAVESFQEGPDPHLSWITDKIAVGDYQSNYGPFDVIVNLNYSANGVNRHEINRTTENGKKIYRIGLLDSPDEPMLEILKQLIPELMAITPDPTILFHCYAGISRSSTCAAAYYAKKNNVSADKALQALVERRSFIRPNPLFLDALKQYLA